MCAVQSISYNIWTRVRKQVGSKRVVVFRQVSPRCIKTLMIAKLTGRLSPQQSTRGILPRTFDVFLPADEHLRAGTPSVPNRRRNARTGCHRHELIFDFLAAVLYLVHYLLPVLFPVFFDDGAAGRGVACGRRGLYWLLGCTTWCCTQCSRQRRRQRLASRETKTVLMGHIASEGGRRSGRTSTFCCLYCWPFIVECITEWFEYIAQYKYFS